MTVKIMRDGTANLAKSIKALTSMQVLVGIPADNAFRPIVTDPDQKEPVNNALLGYVHEYGSPANNIPPRPFLIPGIDSVRKQIAARLRAVAKKALTQAVDDKELHVVGLIAMTAVKKKIVNGSFAPLKEETVYRRQHRKIAPRQGDKPLIDTAQLLNAVTYVIRKA